MRPRDGWWATLLIGDSHLFAVEGATALDPSRLQIEADVGLEVPLW